MSSLYKRAGSPYWWAEFRLPGRKPIRESSRTKDKAAAQEWRDKKQAELWRQDKLGARPRRSWKEAVVRWGQENSHKADLDGDIAKFRWLDAHFGDRYLHELTKDVVMPVLRLKVAESSNSTGNRYLALIRALLYRAADPDDWNWLDSAPRRWRQFKEPLTRVRYLTVPEVTKLLHELAPHARDLLLFAIATGLRQGNVKRLEWSQVDLERRTAWIHADQAKARQAIAVPLNDIAMEILLRIQQQQVVLRAKKRLYVEGFVFTYHGRPIECVNTRAWRQALGRAGIAAYRWHDNRHTWASWLTMAGVSDSVLMALAGWRDPKMVRRYAHLSSSHLAGSAAKIDALLQGSDWRVSHKTPTVEKQALENESQSLDLMVGRAGFEPATNGLKDSAVKKKKAA